MVVIAHRAALEKIAADCLSGGQTAARYKSVEIEASFPGSTGSCRFFSGGFGLVPSSTYCGCYYSEDGVPAAYQNVDVPLSPRRGGSVALERRDGQRRRNPAHHRALVLLPSLVLAESRRLPKKRLTTAKNVIE